MKFDHPSITVEELAPGYFAIAGIPTRNIMTENGQIVPPDRIVIHSGIPSDLLRKLAERLDGGESPSVVLVEGGDQNSVSGSQSLEGEGDEVVTLEQRIINVLADGNIQIGKLAERLDVTADEIKALDGVSKEFHIAHAGWVKPGLKAGEQ